MFIGTGEVKAGTEIAEDIGTLSKVVKETEETEELGIVYERISKTGERYIGQTKSDSRYLARQAEHDRELGELHKYRELGRARPGHDLDVLEETHIGWAGGQ